MAAKKKYEWGGRRAGAGRPKLKEPKKSGTVLFPPLMHASILEESKKRRVSFSRVAVERYTGPRGRTIRPYDGRGPNKKPKVAGTVQFPPKMHKSILKEAKKRGVSFSRVAVERFTKP